MAMTEPPVIPQTRSRRRLVILLAVVAALIGLAFTAAVFFLFLLQARKSSVTQSQSTSRSPFLDVPENFVPGRYKWSDGPKEFFLVLYDDHTFMNQDGTVYPMYRWDINTDGLSITWQRNTSLLTNIEAPGIYTAKTTKGTIVRMDKLPPYQPSQLV